MVSSPGNDLVLQGLTQVVEIITVSGLPHDQISTVFGVLLRPAQGLGIHHVELDVVPIQFEIGADQSHQVIQPGLIGQQGGRELLIKQRSTGADMVHPGGSLEHSRRSTPVRTLDRGRCLPKEAFRQAPPDPGTSGIPAGNP